MDKGGRERASGTAGARVLHSAYVEAIIHELVPGLSQVVVISAKADNFLLALCTLAGSGDPLLADQLGKDALGLAKKHDSGASTYTSARSCNKFRQGLAAAFTKVNLALAAAGFAGPESQVQRCHILLAPVISVDSMPPGSISEEDRNSVRNKHQNLINFLSSPASDLVAPGTVVITPAADAEKCGRKKYSVMSQETWLRRSADNKTPIVSKLAPWTQWWGGLAGRRAGGEGSVPPDLCPNTSTGEMDKTPKRTLKDSESDLIDWSCEDSAGGSSSAKVERVSAKTGASSAAAADALATSLDLSAQLFRLKKVSKAQVVEEEIENEEGQKKLRVAEERPSHQELGRGEEASRQIKTEKVAHERQTSSSSSSPSKKCSSSSTSVSASAVSASLVSSQEQETEEKEFNRRLVLQAAKVAALARERERREAALAQKNDKEREVGDGREPDAAATAQQAESAKMRECKAGGRVADLVESEIANESKNSTASALIMTTPSLATGPDSKSEQQAHPDTFTLVSATDKPQPLPRSLSGYECVSARSVTVPATTARGEPAVLVKDLALAEPALLVTKPPPQAPRLAATSLQTEAAVTAGEGSNPNKTRLTMDSQTPTRHTSSKEGGGEPERLISPTTATFWESLMRQRSMVQDGGHGSGGGQVSPATTAFWRPFIQAEEACVSTDEWQRKENPTTAEVTAEWAELSSVFGEVETNRSVVLESVCDVDASMYAPARWARQGGREGALGTDASATTSASMSKRQSVVPGLEILRANPSSPVPCCDILALHVSKLAPVSPCMDVLDAGMADASIHGTVQGDCRARKECGRGKGASKCEMAETFAGQDRSRVVETEGDGHQWKRMRVDGGKDERSVLVSPAPLLNFDRKQAHGKSQLKQALLIAMSGQVGLLQGHNDVWAKLMKSSPEVETARRESGMKREFGQTMDKNVVQHKLDSLPVVGITRVRSKGTSALSQETEKIVSREEMGRGAPRLDLEGVRFQI